jgi:hypothetical protein
MDGELSVALVGIVLLTWPLWALGIGYMIEEGSKIMKRWLKKHVR